jgi:K+-transporting ATPase ATPase A chain
VRGGRYLLLPVSAIMAVFFVAEGVPQTLAGPVEAQTITGATQLIARGPVASQEAIKLLSGDGGGFFNANSAHPLENPTPLSNLAEMALMLVIGAALTNSFGRMVGNQRQGWAVFAAGLMIGRTPEFLGKKIEAREMKLAVLALLVAPAAILVLTALASALPAGFAGLNNAGPHGFSEILYAYSSAAATNGSAFAGLDANSTYYNATLAVAMFAGRFLVIVPVLAIAGSLAAKPRVPRQSGTLPTDGLQFIVLLVATIIVVGGLTFVPALALGPLEEQLAAQAGIGH